MKLIRLLIADDHPIVRAGLRTLLSSQEDFELVAEAKNGHEALEQAKQSGPDVVLMDLRMGEMDGVEATIRIKQQFPAISVLILTTYEGDRDVLRALEAGATGYLLKDAAPEQLFAAIRAIAQGQVILAPEIMPRLFSPSQPPAEAELSKREIEVLRFVAQGASNKEIARHLHLSEATVKSHLIHIFNKLDVMDRTAAVMVALQRNLLIPPH